MPHSSFSASPEEPAQNLEELGRRFRHACQAGEKPRVEDFLSDAVGSDRVRLIAALLPLELRCRRADGEQPDAREYLARFPEAVAAIQAWFPNDQSGPRPAVDSDQTVAWQPPSSAGEIVLSIVTGPHQGQRFVFRVHDTLVAGRAPDAQWRLDKDPYFSRYHFRIEANPPRCRLIDLESRNGTMVNNRRVTETYLQDGDSIQCGATRISVTITAPKGHSGESEASAGQSAVSEACLKRIGEFTIKRLLGSGSMGSVYEAVESPSGRPVAVKIIRPGTVAGSREIQLFLREAGILSRLRHRRIVEFLGMGLHEGRVYLAMEYIDQLDQQQFLAALPQPRLIKAACEVMAQVLEGLAYAHKLGFVHRDVKPGNILVRRAGRKLEAKLADFGLAKSYLTAGFSSISADNETRGTLAYMSPEQIINCRYALPPCDIYAAGVCLYRFLAGTLPFDLEDGPGAVAKVLNSAPVPLGKRCPDLPTPLSDIVAQALARKPEDRFPSAGDMRKALVAFLAA
jgi:hypothetical protein